MTARPAAVALLCFALARVAVATPQPSAPPPSVPPPDDGDDDDAARVDGYDKTPIAGDDDDGMDQHSDPHGGAGDPVSSSQRGSRALQAGGFGLLSSISLVIGAIVGIMRLPSMKKRAVLMAFGAGALTEATAIELFGNMLLEAGPPMWAGIAAGLVGGLVFMVLNRILNEHGAVIRRLTSASGARLLLELAQRRLAVSRMRQLPAMRELKRKQLQRLAKAMRVETLLPGARISLGGRNDEEGALYIVLSGCVKATPPPGERIPTIASRLPPPCRVHASEPPRHVAGLSAQPQPRAGLRRQAGAPRRHVAGTQGGGARSGQLADASAGDER